METLQFANSDRAKVRRTCVRDAENSCPERSLAFEPTVRRGNFQPRSALTDRPGNFLASSSSRKGLRLVTLRVFFGERIMLTGADLLSKVKELGDVSKSELVRSCGYVSTKKDGTERLNFTAFYEALLEAKGVNLAEGGSAKGKAGRKLSYVATVQGNGNLLVGKAYTALLDLNPGDEFEIKLGRKQIRLVPAGASEED
jgi:hypothetical protein